MAIIVGPKGLQEAACFYAKLLGIDHLDFTLYIERKYLESDIRGLCLYDPDENTIVIELERRNTSDKFINIYSTLAHELVHVKQYVNKELIDIDRNNVLWQGTTIPADNYWDSPWEIEAYGRQQGLYVRWKEYLALKHQ